MAFSPTWLLIAVLSVSCTTAYRLNVPRLLLPFHPSIPATFDLEVGSPAGGCFYWKSSRPDVVSVSPVGDGECSDKAQVVATTKVAGLHSAVIFAEDVNGGTTLSCGVTVDDVHSIAIEHTTKILYVDAAPAPITAVAYNSDGDKFSSLGEIPFEWELSEEGGDKRPLRIVPFEQSKYRAPREIQELEISKKKGYVVLLEGLVTGTSILTAKFQDQFFEKVPSHSLDLVVVANLLLIPSHDLYVPVHSVVQFGVWIVKEQSTEEVSMPSPAYYLQLGSSEICKLDKTSSSVTALKKGTTELSLFTHNVDAKISKNAAVRPPSTKISVVDPESIQFSIGGGNWLLETGRTYKVHVNLLDPHGNYMYIADNTRFITTISLDHLDIIVNSKNGTYFEVVPKKVGKTIFRSKFTAIIDENGIEHLIGRKVTGEQAVEVVEPIRVVPDTLAFPYLPRTKFEYLLKAEGGSGVFSWTSADSSISSVNEASGLVRSGDIGQTQITVTDKRNKKHNAHVKVAVLDVILLSFGKTRREAEVGKDLVLNIQLYGVTKSGEHVPFSDCRSVPFSIDGFDYSIFRHQTKATVDMPKEGTGCATITLRAMSSGDTKATVRFDKYKATIDISAYPALEASRSTELLLASGSRFGISVSGGPRPWILDSSGFFSEGVLVYLGSSTEKIASVDVTDGLLRVTCGNTEGIANINLRVGNKPTQSNALPAESRITLSVCCAQPSRLVLSTRNRKTHTQHVCPSSARAIFVSSPSSLSLTGFGRCNGGEERSFDSLQGLNVQLSVDETKLLSVQQEDDVDAASVSILATPKGKPGNVIVSAKAVSTSSGKLAKPLQATLPLRLVERAVADPSSLVLWNEPTAIGVVQLKGGSGYLHILDTREEFDALVKGSTVEVTPRRIGKSVLRLIDACIDDTVIEVPVKVTDVHSLRIKAPRHLEVEKECEAYVEVVDENGETFSSQHISLMKLSVDVSSQHGELTRIDSTRFRLRGQSVGVVTLSASAHTSEGTLLKSRPHPVQVFSPLLLFPKIVTLIPESTFQLEVVGGPQPTPAISFSQNNSKVADVETNALITSRNLGYTLLTGTVEDGDGRATKDSVLVKVVSLGGVRIEVSTSRVEVGGKVWVRLQGLDTDEVPFAFGGALYPFKVTWNVSDSSVFSMESALGAALHEREQNKFAVWMRANEAGAATVSVTVELHKNAKQHFKGSSRSFTSRVDLSVFESMGLQNPSMVLSALRVAPESELRLKTNWASSKLSWSVPADFRRLASINKDGVLRTFGVEGPAALAVSRKIGETNTTTLVPLQISSAASIDVVMSPALTAPSNVPLTALPVGLTITLNVQFRDQFGMILHAAPNTVLFRPHRFDLTDIHATDSNRTLKITIKSAGETVLKLWDPVDTRLSTFIRLGAIDQLTPATRRTFVVSDIICFNSPIEGKAHWSVSNSHLHFVAENVAVARSSGVSHVQLETEEGQKMHAMLRVASPSHLAFTQSVPSSVSNIEGAKYEFPLTIANLGNETELGSTIGCGDLSSVAIQPPFHCDVSFVSPQAVSAANIFFARAMFLASTKSYACVLEKQVAGTVQLPVTEFAKTDLVITAKWESADVSLVTQSKVPFHIAFEIVEKQVSLSNYENERAVIGVRVSPKALSYIKAHATCGDVISISETRPSQAHASANKHFAVQLNVKAALLWQDKGESCGVIIEDSRTGQREMVPVDIRIVGQTTKHVYDAIGSSGFVDFVLVFVHRYSYLIPPMMTICILSIALLFAYSYIQRGQTRAGVAAMGTSGIFASDAPSPGMSVQSSPGGGISPHPAYHWRNSPPKYYSTPVDSAMSPGGLSARSSLSSASPGSPGSPQLWSTADVRRRH